MIKTIKTEVNKSIINLEEYCIWKIWSIEEIEQKAKRRKKIQGEQIGRKDGWSDKCVEENSIRKIIKTNSWEKSNENS